MKGRDCGLRILAIDYGDARTGLAFSDISATLVGEALVLHEKDPEKLIQRINDEARRRQTGHMVLGLPLNMNGSEGPRAGKSREFAKSLCALGWEVTLWDERRSSADAARILHDNGRHGKKNRERLDAVAASLILEGYLRQLAMNH